MDPVTIAMLAGQGIDFGTDTISQILMMNARNKDRTLLANKMLRAHEIQNESLNRKINLAKKFSRLQDKDALNELVDIASAVSGGQRTMADTMAAQRFRG